MKNLAADVSASEMWKNDGRTLRPTWSDLRKYTEKKRGEKKIKNKKRGKRARVSDWKGSIIISRNRFRRTFHSRSRRRRRTEWKPFWKRTTALSVRMKTPTGDNGAYCFGPADDNVPLSTSFAASLAGPAAFHRFADWRLCHCADRKTKKNERFDM